MKSKLLKRISFSIAVVLLASFCLTGCSVNDSLGSADELEFLLIHSTDKVYKKLAPIIGEEVEKETIAALIVSESKLEKIPSDKDICTLCDAKKEKLDKLKALYKGDKND
jgi:hypothetical protein